MTHLLYDTDCGFICTNTKTSGKAILIEPTWFYTRAGEVAGFDDIDAEAFFNMETSVQRVRDAIIDIYADYVKANQQKLDFYIKSKVFNEEAARDVSRMSLKELQDLIIESATKKEQDYYDLLNSNPEPEVGFEA